MKNMHRGRLLFSTCLTGAALALATGAQAQDRDPTWQPRADVEAETGAQGSQIALELFAPLAQNDSNLLFATGRVGNDERNQRNGSASIGARGRVGNDVAIGVNAGVDFYRSSLTKRSQTAVSFGLEGFTSVFDVRLNYRLPVTDGRVTAFLDPNALPVGVLSIEQNRLIERKRGFRIDEVPLAGFNGEIGARASLAKNFSVRASVGAFDYRDEKADRGYHGFRGGIELDIDDPVGEGSRFSLGARLEDDNRFGTQARAMARLSIPLGRRASSDRSTNGSGLDRQMGDRLRRDYVAESGSRRSDLTTTSFAVDARTGQAFGGVYYTSGTGVAGGAGTSAAPTTIGDAVTRAGANGVVVALGSGGAISTGGVTLAANQYLVGGASSVDVRHANGAVSQFSFGGTNGTVLGTNAAGAAVTLGQGSVIRDLTIRGSGTGVAANGVGGFGLERLVIENTGGTGLSLTNTLGAVVIDGITIRGAGGTGLLVNGGSSVALRNATIGGGASAIRIADNGTALTASLSNLNLSAAGGTVLDIDGSGAGTVTVAGLSGINIAGGNGETGGFAARFATFDAATAAGIQTVDAGRMQVGTNAARVNGAGVSLTEVTGALSFADLDVSNNAGTGLIVRNTKSGDFTLTTLDGTVDTTGAAALDLDPLYINLNFASVSSAGSSGAGVILDNVHGAGPGGNALNIGTLTITNAALQGLFITGGSTGLVTIGGGSIVNSGGASVQVGEAGIAGSGGTIGLNFGGTISDSVAGPLVSLFNIGGAIRFTGAINGAGPILVNNTLPGSSIGFTGATTLIGAASPAVSIDNLLGSFSFTGPLTIANPAGDAIRIGTVAGGVTFGDVDITGLGSGTGLDLTGAQGDITFGTLDIAGTGVAGSTGINLTGATNAGAVVITRPSTVQGVAIGVNLTNAAISGSFRFGDGNSGDGLESSITANTPLVITGMDTTRGTYDFADVKLNGDITALTGGSFTAYYVLAGATGSGATSGDAGNLAGAEASGAQYIVLLNDPNGGQDVIDAITAGGSLDLVSGQTLVSFLNSDFISVTGATVPTNLIVSGIGATGITNPFAGSGAAILTTTGPLGSATVNLANGAKLDGVVIQNGAAGGVGVAGSGVSNVSIVNSNISGSGGAISLIDNGVAASATLSNLNLSASSGTVLSLSDAGAGTLTVSGSGININATGNAAAVNISQVAVGSLQLGTITSDVSGTNAVVFDGISGGSLTTGNINVGGTGAGAGVTITRNSAAVATGAITVAGSGADAVLLSGNSGAISLGALNLTGAAGAGLRVSNTGSSVTVAGGTVANAAGGAVVIDGVKAAGSVSIGTLSTSGGGAGITLNDVDGAVAFTGVTTIANPGATGITLGAGSAGTIAFGDVDITGLAANMTGVDARNASGTVTFNTLDITGASASGTRGIDLTGATFAGNVTSAQGGTIAGVGVGVDLTNAAITGGFRYGDGSSTDADGAASFINATTPILANGLNAGQGTYDFKDVNLSGDTSALSTSAKVFYVLAGASGAGTLADPGSLSGAEGSLANIIILLNNPAGGNDVLDATDAGGSFDLVAGQSLLGFLNGDTIALPGGAPANLQLFGIAQGSVTNPFAGSGAPVLTTNTAVGAGTLNLAGGVTIDGVSIDNNSGGVGLFGSGLANVIIRNSRISGDAGAMIVYGGAAAASISLTGLNLSSRNSDVVLLDGGGAGTLTVTGLDIRIDGGKGETGGFNADRVIFDADLTTAGYQTVIGAVRAGTSASRLSGDGFVATNANGDLRLTSADIANSGNGGLVLIGDANLTVRVDGGSIDTDTGLGIVAQNLAMGMNFGTVASASGIMVVNTTAADPAIAALAIDTLKTTDGGMTIVGGGTYSVAHGSITDSSSMAIFVSGAADLRYAGDITSNGNAFATIYATAHTGTLNISGTIDATAGAGLQFDSANGTYNFSGITNLHGGGAGIGILNSAGTFQFGAGTSVTDGAIANFMLQNSSANVTYLGSLTQGLSADSIVVIGQTGGTLDFSGATIKATAGPGLYFDNADGTNRFGDVALSGGSGIAITNDSSGAFTFGNVDITGVGAGQTAVDLTGAGGNVTFQTLDITGTSAAGSKGIDLTGSTTAANIVTTESGTITGVGVGVDLTNAAITGTFRYGDGSSADADGAASFINATTPIAITGINGAQGTYNFSDVNLTGDTSALTSTATMFWVKAGASGIGTRGDPGSLGAAEASGANIVILLNDPTGGNDTIDANDPVYGAGGTFNMIAGQQLVGFLNGDTLNVPAGGAPSNMHLFGIASGSISNPFAGSGAPTLTTIAGGAMDTVVVANNAVIDGVVIANGGTGTGVIGSGTSNVTIRNSAISGADSAIELSDGNLNASLALSNLTLRASNNSVVLAVYKAGAGSTSVTQLSNVTIEGGYGESGGAYFAGAIFDADLATAGYQVVNASLQVGSGGARVTGTGLVLTNAIGALNFTGLGVFNRNGNGLALTGSTLDLTSVAGTVDTRDGTTISLNAARTDLILDNIVHSGTGRGVLISTLTGIGLGGRALQVAKIDSASTSGGSILLTGNISGGISFGSASSITNTNGQAISIASGTGTLDFRYDGSVSQTNNAALVAVSGHNGSVTFGAGSTLSASNGTGLQFDNADGTYAFNGTTTLNGGDAGIDIVNGSAGSFTFGANTSIVSPTGSAINIAGSTAGVTYAGSVTQANNAALLTVLNHSGGTLAFTTGTLAATSGTGLQFDNADGTYNFTGTTTLNGGDAGIDIVNGSAGSFTFGANTSIVSPSGTAINIASSTAGVAYAGSVTQANNAALLTVLNHSGGTLAFAGTLAASNGSGLSFDNADGTYQFGSFTLSGGARIAVANGSAGAFTFGDVDITGLAANTTAVNLTGATGSVTFNTLDITGASLTGTKGMDLSGNATAGNITVNDSSTISGVAVGIDLTNAAMSGNFRYGDGSNADADGAASTVSATTPLLITGLNGAAGTYNFADVNLVGDTSNLSVSAYFVLEGASGVGTRSDPGSLTGAEASSAQYIVLLRDFSGNTNTIDAGSAGGSLDLDGGQYLYSFRDTDRFNAPGGAPANVALYNVQSGVIDNPFAGSGAPTLTASGAAPTVVLGGSNVLDGLVITNSGTGAGVSSPGIGGIKTIQNSTISGGAAGAINVTGGALFTTLSLNNLNLSGAGGNVVNLTGAGVGSVIVSRLSNITVTHATETGGLNFSDVTFDSDPVGAAGFQQVAAGAVTLGTTGSRITGDALKLNNVLGDLNLGTLNIANSGGTGLLVTNPKANNFVLGSTGGAVDTIGGTAINLDPLKVGMTLGSVSATGGANALVLRQVEGLFTVSGAVNVLNSLGTAIVIENNTAQTDPLKVAFQGAVTINNAAAGGVSMDNNAGATVSFTGGLGITTANAAGFTASNGGTLIVTGAANSISATGADALYLDRVTLGAGGVAFNSLGATNGVALTAKTLALAGSLDVAGMRVSGGSGNAAYFANLSGAGAVNLTGTIDLDDRGLHFTGALGTINIANVAGSSLTLDGGGNAIELDAVTGGTVNIATAAGSASIGATTSSGTTAVWSDNGTGGTLNYGGTINVTAGNALWIAGGAGTINLTGAITSNISGTGFGFFDADGTYNISGAVSHVGGTAVRVDGASGGAISFSGASKSFATGNLFGVRMSGTGTLTFSGGGLAIDATTGTGLLGEGGTLIVTGAGNSITTTTGTVLNLSAINAGTGGINFATLSTTNGAATGISLANVGSSGGSIALGTVNLQGMTARGIDIGGTLGAALSITDLDIGLNGSNAVAFDLSGATLSAGIAVGDFDVTSALVGTTIGVDLRGATGGQTIQLGDTAPGGASSSIAGVRTGIFLDAASNALFTFGDGTAAGDTGSTISAITAIDATSAPASGTYNFRDITFTASPGAGFGLGKVFFVDADGATGGGNGSGADGANPMTLAEAELAAGVQDIIVLINNGAAISAAGSNGNDSLVLRSGMQVRGFGNGLGGGAGSGSAPIALTITVPSTILLSGGSTINIADPTGGGAATLTSSAGAKVIRLGAANNRISGFILEGSSVGITGPGATDTTINFMTVRNFAVEGISFSSATRAMIDNLVFSGNHLDILLNASDSALTNIASTGATGIAILIPNATGTTTLTNVSVSGATGGGILFSNAAGLVSATNVDITNTGDSALGVDGGTASFTFDATSSITHISAGRAVSVGSGHSMGSFTYAGSITATGSIGLYFRSANGTYAFTGTTILENGDQPIFIFDGSAGTFTFGAGTAITYSGGVNAFYLDGNADVTYSGSIDSNGGRAVYINNHDSGTVTFDTGTIKAHSATVTGILVDYSNGGTINFNGPVDLSTVGDGVVLRQNAGGTVVFNAAGNGLDITTTTGSGFFANDAGTVIVKGSGNSIKTSSGPILNIMNSTANAMTLDMTFARVENAAGSNGILIDRTSTGSIGGSLNISDGAITATTRGIYLKGEALNFTYGGSVTTSGAVARSIEVTGHSGGTATFSGTINDSALGISVANNTGGVIALTGSSNLTTADRAALSMTNNSGTTINLAGLGIATTGSGAGLVFSGGGTLNVTGTNNIQTQNGQIINLSGGTIGSSGATFASLKNTGSTAGTAINLNNIDGGAFNGGTVTIAGTTGVGADGIFYGGGSTSNVAFGAVTISATADDGIEVNGAGNGTFTVSSATINNTGGDGIEINGSTNSVTITGGAIGATNDPTGRGVYVVGGTGPITIGASITKTTADNVVFINGHTTNAVTLSGAISATGATSNGIVVQNVTSGAINFDGATKQLTTGANGAVNLLNNTGGTINFRNGGLAISSTSGIGFNASGGGTIAVEGANNTIASTTGIALNVSNTTIGSGDLTFSSIASNGAANGIVLNKTGSLGGLNVTGGASADSGGIIQNSAGDGIKLTETEKVRLTYMKIAGNLGNGIYGSTVNGFVLNDMVITGNGNDAGLDESGINMVELTGTGATGARPTGIFNSTISNNYEFEVQIANSKGILQNFQLKGTKISSTGAAVNGGAAHGNLFNFLGTSTGAYSATMGITVANSQFTGNAPVTGTGLHIDIAGSGTMKADVGTSAFKNNNAGINVSTGPGNAILNYRINGNTFTGQRVHAINDFQNGDAAGNRTVYGTITNNVIGEAAVVDSGSQLGNGIRIANEGAVTSTYLISNNIIQQIKSTSAIAVNVGLGGATTGGKTTELTITNNTINNIGGRAIVIQDNQDATLAPYPTIWVNMTGNSFSGIYGLLGDGSYLRFKATSGVFKITQKVDNPAGVDPQDLDDANNFSGETGKVSVSGGVTFNGGALAPPPAFVALP